MRSLWTGSLSFGLVNIPVRLYSASNSTGLDLDMIHKTDHAPVKYAKVCSEDGKELKQEDIVKGYKGSDGEYIVLTDEDFKAASREKTEQIDIVAFAQAEEVNPMFFEKPYYLEPSKGAAKPYVLLREALAASDKVAIARFVMRNKEHLAVLQPNDDIIVLTQLRFVEEIRKPDELKIPGSETVNKKELDMALALIDQLTEKFEPEQFTDTYRESLMKMIEEKSKGKKISAPKSKPKQSAKVTDIMDLLKASLEKKASASASDKSKATETARREPRKVPRKKAV